MKAPQLSADRPRFGTRSVSEVALCCDVIEIFRVGVPLRSVRARVAEQNCDAAGANLREDIPARRRFGSGGRACDGE